MDPARRRIFVGLGSNQDQPRDRVLEALAALAELDGWSLVRGSRLWQTAPWGRPDQPEFVNAVAEFAAPGNPRQLLDGLLATETALGRRREGGRWGPRRIDLDLLAVDDHVCDDETLTLPHPRLSERRFVLAPWSEIAPSFRLPDGHTVAEQLERCADDGKATPLAPLRLVAPVPDLRECTGGWRAAGQTVALVPTMGNLHAGHLSLVTRARDLADRVVVSLFVNPTQFGPGEDFEAYPRTLAADLAALADAGADLAWVPRVSDVYPLGLDQPAEIAVAVPAAGALCDGGRPGHFAGVASVVARLFGAVEPDVAVFGQKDLQQLRLIERMVTELLMAVRIESGPVVREPSGLALSSRNGYLSAAQRQRAAALHQGLSWLRQAIVSGRTDFSALEAETASRLERAGLAPQYVSVRRASDLAPAAAGDRELAVLAAARLGPTRLIDNLIFDR